MALLYSPLKIKEITFKNRIVVSPMCQYSSEDGFANDWHLVHLGSRAVGGAGLIITEAAAVSPEGRISPEDLGIWKDEHIANLRRITDFIHNNGSVAGIQLAHAGRKAGTYSPWKGGGQVPIGEGGWQTISASALPFYDKDRIPVELDKAGIDRIISDFKDAAKRSLEAGFKLLEIHAAHGYLLNQFLSPFSNQRKDEYGGSFENRIRLLLDVVDAVNEVWPRKYPLFVRISATEWVEGGWDISDSINLGFILKSKGVDLIDCSSGANIPAVRIPLFPGYQVQLADEVKNKANILTGAVGLITEADQAEEILKEGKADLIFFAREYLRNPHLALDFAQDLGVDMEWPNQYKRGKL